MKASPLPPAPLWDDVTQDVEHRGSDATMVSDDRWLSIDDWWWSLMIDDDHWCLVIDDDHWLMMINDDRWWSLMIDAEHWDGWRVMSDDRWVMIVVWWWMRDDGLWLENERKRGLQSSKMRPRYLLKHSRRPLGGPRARLELSGFESLSGSFLDDFLGPGRHLKQQRRNAWKRGPSQWMTESGFQPVGVALVGPTDVIAYL